LLKSRETLLEAARAYERLAQIHYLDNAKVRCLHAAFRTLNLAESDEMREDRAYLETVRQRFAKAGIEAETELARGEPADEIVRLAEERGVDLIAMSTHGHRFVADLIFGSTVHKVRHVVQIPVLLLRAPRE